MLNDFDRRNLSLMRQQWREETCLDETLVEQLSRANLASFRVWEKAKPRSDFAAWLPCFKNVVELAQRKSAALANVLREEPYQAMLSQYNPGLRNETVNAIFTQLHARLPSLIQRISAKQTQEPPLLPIPPVAIEAQRRIVARLITAMGFDAQFSRLDESAHPFSTGEWDDVRITTRYRESNILSAIMGAVHELGHLFYSRNLPRQWQGQPIGQAQSMWVHESQSLFWERQIGGSLAFMEFLSPLIARELASDDPAWDAQNLHRIVTRVQPGLIRIEADEVTYPAHIILRHKLEQELLAGALLPENLPTAWAHEMRELLAVDVPDHAHGCMQDVHWTDGTFGYFPAYTFGALAAAQLMAKAKEVLPQIDEWIRAGNFTPILTWLVATVHQQGSLYDGEELVIHATGKPLSIQPWLDQVDARYLS